MVPGKKKKKNWERENTAKCSAQEDRSSSLSISLYDLASVVGKKKRTEQATNKTLLCI